MRLGTRVGLLLLVLVGFNLRAETVTAQTDTDLDVQCGRFADTVVPAVLNKSPWDLNALVEVGVPELQGLLTGDSPVLRFFRAIGEALGGLTSLRGPSVEVTITRNGDQHSITCVYRADGEFEHGPGAITFRARVADGRWRATAINVDISSTPDS